MAERSGARRGWSASPAWKGSSASTRWSPVRDEEGCTAEIQPGANGGAAHLRLRRCPVRALVDVTRAP